MESEKLSSELASLAIASPANRPSRTPHRLRLPAAAGVAVAAAAAAYIAYAAGRPYLEAAVFATEVETTEILSLTPAALSTELTAGGYVVPRVLSKVGSKLRGRVAEVAARQGRRVAKGDLLLRLDDTDQRSALAGGAARLLAREAALAKKSAELAEIERKLARENTLVETGAVSRAAAEDLAAQAVVLAYEVKAARAERDAAGAELGGIRAGLADLSITAPIAGTILTKPPELGEVVAPELPELLELADFDTLEVEAEIPESRLAKVHIGAPCEIMLDAFPDRRRRGVVRELTPLVNRAKATVVARVAFAASSDGALPNMSARVFILDGEESAAGIGQPPKIVVPSSALVERVGAQVVFVVDGDRVRTAEVAVGAPFGPGLELVEGPRAGTRLVKHPPPALSEGHRIKERKK